VTPPAEAPARTPVRVWVRDVLVCIACVCVIAMTVLMLALWQAVGSALDEARIPDPSPTWECTPSHDWPC
jgi:hypothetical protein